MKRTKFTLEEIDRMLSLASNYSRAFEPYRMRAIVYFLIYTKITMYDLIKVQRHHFNFKTNSVWVRQLKDRTKIRKRTLPSNAIFFIKQYFALDPPGVNAFNVTNASIVHLFKYMRKFQPEGRHFVPSSLSNLRR